MVLINVKLKIIILEFFKFEKNILLVFRKNQFFENLFLYFVPLSDSVKNFGQTK